MAYYRIAKQFEVEYGHRLCKHPEKCRFPHGHSLRIEIVVRGRSLDGNDMVCDYKALKMLVLQVVGRLDHAMALNSKDPQLDSLSVVSDRVLLFDNQDPTTEVLTRWIFHGVREALASGRSVTSDGGIDYRVPDDLELERVRVWETRTSWAEYVDEHD
jgi:6-pyruvoyltetrahydropterin/6-carboxytetrahydropterin synthase